MRSQDVSCSVGQKGQGLNYGEHNSSGNLHGKGIHITHQGTIYIQNWKYDEDAAGNEMTIWFDGHVSVGEYFVDESEELKWRGTRYYKDGSSLKIGFQ